MAHNVGVGRREAQIRGGGEKIHVLFEVRRAHVTVAIRNAAVGDVEAVHHPRAKEPVERNRAGWVETVAQVAALKRRRYFADHW